MHSMAQYDAWASTIELTHDDMAENWENATTRQAPLFVAAHAAAHDPATYGTLISEVTTTSGTVTRIVPRRRRAARGGIAIRRAA